MSDLICFTQYFVNKQNVRSFSNILNLKLLKCENSEMFLQRMFEGEYPMQNISVELKEILLDLQRNVKLCSVRDFKNYFVKLKDKEPILFPVSKDTVFTGCWNALCEMIPKKIFGNNHNTKILRKCVKAIVFSMNRQYLELKKIIQKWDYNRFPLNTSITFSFQILYIILKWIFKYILSAVISLNFYVTTCKIDNDENKLHFFWKNQWQGFYDRKIFEMATAKVIQKFEPNCIGKKIKQKYSSLEKIKLKVLKKEIPKLHLILKANYECRPIVQYKNEMLNQAQKNKIKENFFFLKKIIGKLHEKIETQFRLLLTHWLAKQQPKLYFIKTDLSNAFGSINKANLLKILHERHLQLQRTEECLFMKKKHAQHYKDLVADLRQPLLVRAGSTVFEWKEGLVQGYKYSPALSELYYSYMDEIYFSEHIKTHELRLFTRVVDDYLYITESLEDAYLFLKALSNYKNINYGKTVVNFTHTTIRFSKEINFLGYSYNTETMQVSRANTIFTGQICYKIVFSAATANLAKFLENRIGQSGIQINSHIFNFHHNNEELIWRHIFLTLCLSANKFCTILAILCNEKEMVKYLSVYKKKVSVKLCHTLVETLEKNRPYEFSFVYCINHFRYLSFKALLLCAIKTDKCNVLVSHINRQLAKSNCIYGKWREHSRRYRNEQYQVAAVRDICRRTDLRQIFKHFDKLPHGVQCYNHNVFYQL